VRPSKLLGINIIISLSVFLTIIIIAKNNELVKSFFLEICIIEQEIFELRLGDGIKKTKGD
jgi:hypothetical protein